MEVCRLCLDLQSDNTYSPLDGTYKDMVQVVAPELNLEISNAPIVCNECSSNLDELFIFKTRCFEHEEKLRPKCENIKNKFRLKEVLDGTTGGDGTALKKETTKDRICRACLGPIECESFTILKPSEPDAYLDSMLTMCLPELDLELTKDPVMCEACLENLQKLHHFKSTCLDIEDKLASYCESHGTNSSDQINLNSVLESELKMDEDDSDYSNIKSEQFDDESKDTSMKSENDSEMMGDAELKHEEVDIKSETDASAAGSSSDKFMENLQFPNELHEMLTPPFDDRSKGKEEITRQVYECSECEFKTKHKNVLFKHSLTQHGNWKECPYCKYKTLRQEYITRHLLVTHGIGDERKWRRCPKCYYKTVNSSKLRRHVKGVHKHDCSRCDSDCDFKKAYEVKYFVSSFHEESPGGEIPPDTQTNPRLPSDMQRRERIIPGELKRHKCSECRYQTNSSGTIKRHLLTVHKKGDQSKWKNCPKCSYKTAYTGDLNKHIRFVHEGLKKHECSDCNFKTNHKDVLLKHLMALHGNQS